MARKSSKKASKKSSAPRGRKSAYTGKTLTKLVKDNPRRAGTHGFKSFALIKNGMSYEDYLAKGGRRNDLAWDIAHKYVKVS